MRLRSALRCLLSVVLGAALLLETGCATTNSKKSVQSGKSARIQKRSGPKSYSLVSNSDIEWKLIKRGRRVRGGPALDSY